MQKTAPEPTLAFSPHEKTSAALAEVTEKSVKNSVCGESADQACGEAEDQDRVRDIAVAAAVDVSKRELCVRQLDKAHRIAQCEQCVRNGDTAVKIDIAHRRLALGAAHRNGLDEIAALEIGWGDFTDELRVAVEMIDAVETTELCSRALRATTTEPVCSLYT